LTEEKVAEEAQFLACTTRGRLIQFHPDGSVRFVIEPSLARCATFLSEDWVGVIFVDDQNEVVLIDRERNSAY